MDSAQAYALKIPRLALACLVPVAMMIVAMVVKPLWRDEYWSLFFSEPSMDLATIVKTRMLVEIHPPLYYIGLHGWRGILPDDPVIGRFFSIPFLLIGAGLIWLLARNKRETLIFLLVSLGSYWVVYFTTELRHYVLLFVGAAIGVFVLARIVEDTEGKRAWLYPTWAAIGVLLSMTHYFGGIWFAAVGLCAGLWELKDKHWGRFFAIGVATTLALAPAAVWTVLSIQTLDPNAVQLHGNDFVSELVGGLNQLLRGLIVKNFGSNPMVVLAGFAGLVAAFQLKDKLSGILVLAVLLTVLIAFAVHLTAFSWIKERAFIVIMPTFIFILSRHIAKIRVGDGWSARFASFIPLACIITPFLFIPEYFKDREQFGDLQRYVSTYSKECKGQPLVMYYRFTHYHDDFHPTVARWVLRADDGSEMFQQVKADPEGPQQAAPQSTCPVKAAALMLENGEGASQDIAREAFARAGVNVGQLKELNFGKGRNIMLVDEQAAAAAHSGDAAP